jgi:Zn-dependent protease with chaperone function
MTGETRRRVRTTLFAGVLIGIYAVLAGTEFVVQRVLNCEDVPACRLLLEFLAVLVAVEAALATFSWLRQTVLDYRLRRLGRSAVPYSARVQRVIDNVGLTERVTVIEGNALIACTSGLLRGNVVISSGLLDQLTLPQLEAVLRHERSHVDSADPFLYMLMSAVRRMFFYAPVVASGLDWLAARRELAADACAIRQCGVRPLAGALHVTLRVGSRPAEPRPVRSPRPHLADGADLLELRLRQLEMGHVPLQCRVPRKRLVWTAPGALVLILALLAVARVCCLCLPCPDC